MAAATCSITLRNIAKGGITDQVGKGVSRYSVDDHWHIPHFEKMLYDQAQLLSSALEAALLVPANKPEVREELQAFASDILTYVERDLTHKDGGFYSAEDADSFDAESGKNREGAVYVWRETELRQILGDDFGLFAYRFGVEREGNVPSEVDQHDELKGKVRRRCVWLVEDLLDARARRTTSSSKPPSKRPPLTLPSPSKTQSNVSKLRSPSCSTTATRTALARRSMIKSSRRGTA